MSRQGVSEEEAARITKETITELGYNEHHAGSAANVVDQNWYNSYPSTVLDADYGDQPGAKWTAGNATQYGSIVRYLRGREDMTEIIYEPRYLRYVDKENVEYITKRRLTLEECLNELNEKQELIVAREKWKKQKRKNIRWPVVVAGVVMILLTFVFSPENLSSPFTDSQ